MCRSAPRNPPELESMGGWSMGRARVELWEPDPSLLPLFCTARKPLYPLHLLGRNWTFKQLCSGLGSPRQSWGSVRYRAESKGKASFCLQYCPPTTQAPFLLPEHQTQVSVPQVADWIILWKNWLQRKDLQIVPQRKDCMRHCASIP